MPDMSAVIHLLESNAPYTPLGGWLRPGQDEELENSPLWFQNDWVHADLAVPGSDLFMEHEAVSATARRFYDAEVIVPHTLYVNVMAGIKEYGPAHTDNPVFEGLNRTNTPMMLLRSMFWSGLFGRWAIRQATSIWWLNDVEGGGLRYWPHGPEQPPERHVDTMANTALVGDNHGMFHQVEPVGPFDTETRLVTSRAKLAPVADGSGDWAVTDRGEERYRAPLESFRVSVLWKAHVYQDEEERQRLEAETLSLEDVAQVFGEDLKARGCKFRFDPSRLDDLSQYAALAQVYPEQTPIEAGVSFFESYT